MNNAPAVRIDIRTDYVCPFCYLQTLPFDRFLDECQRRQEVVWHAFEPRPEPIPLIEADGDYLTSIWRKAVYPLAFERMRHTPPVVVRGVAPLGHFHAALDRILQ